MMLTIKRAARINSLPLILKNEDGKEIRQAGTFRAGEVVDVQSREDAGHLLREEQAREFDPNRDKDLPRWQEPVGMGARRAEQAKQETATADAANLAELSELESLKKRLEAMEQLLAKSLQAQNRKGQ